MLGDALDYIGSSLEKPGRAVRGLMTGNLRAGLAAVPFSDSMGLTDPSQKVTGRNLTDKMGLTRTGDKGWGSWIAGGAADMATDPLSYIPTHSVFKALKMGSAAEHGLTATPFRDAVQGSLAPLPVDTAAMRLGSKVNDASRPRRFSLDPARKDYYAQSRSQRFADRLGFGNQLTPETRSMISPSLGYAPFAPDDVSRVTGRSPSLLTFDEAKEAYAPWRKSLSKPERKTIAGYTSSAAHERVAHALRGSSVSSGGYDLNPFKSMDYNSDFGLHTPEDVMKTMVPWMDKGLAKGRAPNDFMAYRLADRLGDLNMDNAQSMVGRTVSDPSYLSTTINPWGRFYASNADPAGEMLFDMMIPKGSRGGYLGGMSKYDDEAEMLLPRNSKFRVAGVQGVPVQKFGRNWHRLDPAGKPIPTKVAWGDGPFVENAHRALYGHEDVPGSFANATAKHGVFGNNMVVPDELMRPDWRDWVRDNKTGEGVQNNVLLEMLSGSRQSGARVLDGSNNRAASAVHSGSGSQPGGAGLSARLRHLREDIPVFKQDGRVIGAGDWAGNKDMAGTVHKWISGQDGYEGANIAQWHSGNQHIGSAAGTAGIYSKNPSVAREEIMHAITAKAAQEGNVGSLPMLAQPAAQLYRAANATGSRTLRGLGSIADELSAKTMAQRTTRAKLGAALDFLLSPQAHQLYDPQFAAHGFIPRAAYHSVPLASPAGALGAAGYSLTNGE